VKGKCSAGGTRDEGEGKGVRGSNSIGEHRTAQKLNPHRCTPPRKQGEGPADLFRCGRRGGVIHRRGGGNTGLLSREVQTVVSYHAEAGGGENDNVRAVLAEVGK